MPCSSQRIEVITASNGDEALKLIQEAKPHLVFLDIKMPGMSGIDVLKEAKQIDPTVKIIMISAVEDDECVKEAKSLGASDYVTKPFSLNYLEDQVLEKVNCQLYEELRKEVEEKRP